MFRRRFIQSMGLASVGSLAAAGSAEGLHRQSVTYRVKGFSCPTCSVGLEVMLMRQKDVVHATASYPKATVVIEFQPELVTESALQGFISEMGFTALPAKS